MIAPIVTLDIRPVVQVETTWPDGRKVFFVYEATQQVVRELEADVDVAQVEDLSGLKPDGMKVRLPADGIVPEDILTYLRELVRGKIEQMVAKAAEDLGMAARQTRTQRN